MAVDSEPVHGPHPFEIEFADGTVHGRVLNRFSGGATLEGDTVVLGAIAATGRTVVVGVSNPLGDDAPQHELHDLRILTGKD